MAAKEEILTRFQVFRFGDAGIGAWLKESTDPTVLDRLSRVDDEPLSKVQLNQLLVLGHEGSITDAFFRYYWLRCPGEHPYNVAAVEGFEASWFEQPRDAITSIEQLRWGLLRVYIDGLLYFGNVRTAFRSLRAMTEMEYDLVQHPERPGFLRLVERLTKSVVRIQTDDPLLVETFWNHYHNR